MRPCAFQSRIVVSCVVTSTRLCTCIKSTRFVCNRANERSIDSIPACLPRVQTFVARKTESRIPSFATRLPITSSDRPYMGDESITRAPSFTNSKRTSSSCFSLSGLRSTSNTFQVPRPITGSFSPDDGIARVSIPNNSLFVCAHPTNRQKQTGCAHAKQTRSLASRHLFGMVHLEEDDKHAFVNANREQNNSASFH